MSKVSVDTVDGIRYVKLKSPATGQYAVLPLDGPYKWKFNGDLDKPTLSPSVLLTGNPIYGREHFFVRDGQIQYLNDCAHTSAGTTVDMVEIDI